MKSSPVLAIFLTSLLNCHAGVVRPGIYVGSNDKGLFVSNDEGNTWSTRTTADGLPSNTVTNVLAFSGKLYASSPAGLAVSANNGQSWTASQGLPRGVVSKLRSTRSRLFAALDERQSGYVSAVYYTDNGDQWRQLNRPPALTQSTNEVVDVGENAIYWANENQFLVSTDEGTSWELVGGGGLKAVVAAGDKLIATRDNGDLALSIDRGRTWRGVLGARDAIDQYSVAGTFENTIFFGTVVQEWKGLYITKDNGNRWQRKTQADGLPNDEVYGVGNIGSHNVYIATSAGLYVSNDGGENWRQKLNETNLRGLLVLPFF